MIQCEEKSPLLKDTNNTNENLIEDEGRVPLDDGTIPGEKPQGKNDLDVIVAKVDPKTNYGLEVSNGEGLEEEAEESKFNFARFMHILGPGLMVCLADTDGPCLLIAAQSGSQYRYSLVLCQLILIPVLYAAQELTARLAVCTKQGITALIRQHYGRFWAWFACTLHVLMCWVGQASEFGAMGQLYFYAFGVDRRLTNTVQFIVLCSIIFMGRLGYRAIEMVGIGIGSLQLVFVALMFVSQANPGDVVRGLGKVHFEERNYEILLAGNIGAVVMPWMLYYQQSAVCERKIKRKDLVYERADTLIGAVLAQIVMASMVIGMGSLRYYGPSDVRGSMNFGDIIKGYAQSLSGTTWESIQPGATSILDIQPMPDLMLSQDQQAEIFAGYEAQMDTWYTNGSFQIAKWITVLGVSGACMVASMVLNITSVWSVSEILDLDRDLFRPYKERPLQYYMQVGGLTLAYGLSMLTDISQSWFAILTQTINGLLILPVALFLWLLASSPKVLPKEYRLQGFYKWFLAAIFSIICTYCIYGMIQEFINPI